VFIPGHVYQFLLKSVHIWHTQSKIWVGRVFIETRCSKKVKTGASLICENIVRFSRDFYETILVRKFPSRKISEKCASHRSWITDIQSFLPFHRTQCKVRILAVISLRAAETRWWAGRRLRHLLCNSELCCNNWLAAAAALPWALQGETRGDCLVVPTVMQTTISCFTLLRNCSLFAK